MSACRLRLCALIGIVSWLGGCSNDDGGVRCDGRSNVYVGSVEITGLGPKQLSDLTCAEVVTGDLSLKYLDQVSLEPLQNLIQVTGNLTIGESGSLQSLHGLERLELVGGSLTIGGLPQLSSIEALRSLKKVGGDVDLEHLPMLQSLTGLESLTAIGGDLSISFTAGLSSLQALSNLARVGRNVELYDNSLLASARLGGSWPNIGGAVSVMDNPALVELSGIGTLSGENASCAPLNDNFSVFQNAALETITLPASSGELCVSISSNPALRSISGDALFGGSGSLTLLDLPSLSSVDFSGWWFDYLRIQATGLQSLSGLNSCPVRCYLELVDNPRLTDMTAMQQPGSFNVEYHVANNAALATCQAKAIADSLVAPHEICRAGDKLVYGTRTVTIEGNNDAATCP